MDNQAKPIVLSKDEGRHYAMGAMSAIFKADEAETSGNYSVSEWWLEPHSLGSGPHSHAENDEIFLVLEGTMSFLVGEEWIDAEQGTFLRIPATVTHDFANRTDKRAGIFNVYIPGSFERSMPSIVQWFQNNPQ